MIDLNNEHAGEYLAGSCERLATIENDLLALEQRGADIDEEIEERVDRVFQGVHWIKGGADFFDLGTIRELAHQIEDALGLMRSRKRVPTPDEVRVLLRATECLNELVQNVGASNQTDIAEITVALSRLCVDRKGSAGQCGASAGYQARPDGGPLRVLLVEDDFASRLLLQTFLSRYGECHIAVNGREAVTAFRSAFERNQRYDLICMDIMMPEMDGREAVRQIRATEEASGILSTFGAKIIMTTAVDEIKEVSRCFQEFCDAYLLKPIDLARLLGHMRSYGLIQ